MVKPWVAIAFAGGIASAQPKPADPLVDGAVLEPDLELGGTKITPPAMPAFDMPRPNADGTHSAREMRINGKTYLRREITVKGFITFAYDCVADVRKPGMTERAAKDLIDADPTLCERPKFFVGDSKTTRRELSVWVVDVSRVYNKLELARIKKPDRVDPKKCEPNETDPKKKICPSYKAGDQVEVTGTLMLVSPNSERNSDGLLIYKSMSNVTARWKSPDWAVAVPWAPPPQPPSTLPPMTAIPKPATIAKVRQSVYDESKRLATEAAKAYGSRQWDTAIDGYTKATLRWRDNHAAWYGLALAHAQKADWSKAVDAASGAVVVHPANAMYRLLYGRMLREKAIWQARHDQARRENRSADVVEVDYSTINFEKALAELRLAVALESRLWRAHYLIGAILRDAGNAKDAAAAFAKSLEAGPTEAAPFIALAELCRAWDYPDQAIQVSELGRTAVPDPVGTSELWFEIAMGYDDKRLDDKAIAAFTKALDAQPLNYKARFGRGQAYFRKGVFDKAKGDLEEFSKQAGPKLEFFKQQASRMLMEIAAKPKR